MNDEISNQALKLPSNLQAKESNVDFKHYDKKWKVNWFGTSIFVLYCCALVFYLFIRITKTMNLGSYLACVPPPSHS